MGSVKWWQRWEREGTVHDDASDVSIASGAPGIAGGKGERGGPPGPAPGLAPLPASANVMFQAFDRPGRVTVEGRPYEAVGIAHVMGGGERLVVRPADPRTTCVGCHGAIPPGKAGRRCAECRKLAARTGAEWVEELARAPNGEPVADQPAERTA
jgi:hypothetical protein